MLYTLTRSPWKSDINALLRLLTKKDDLLLLQDGVTAAVNNSRFIKKLNFFDTFFVSALREDIEARGLCDKISSKITVVDYIDFVNLVIKHNSQVNW